MGGREGVADALGGLVDIGMVSRAIHPEEAARGGDAVTQREVHMVVEGQEHGGLGELEEGAGVGTQVRVMQESVLLETDVNECRVEAGYEFLDLAQVQITHSETGINFFVVQLHQFLVLQECDLHTLGGGIDDEFFVQAPGTLSDNTGMTDA